jgi:hypothetical protein
MAPQAYPSGPHTPALLHMGTTVCWKVCIEHLSKPLPASYFHFTDGHRIA